MSQIVSLSTLKVAGRLANAMVLDLMRISNSGGGDLTDLLIRTAVLYANQNHVLRDPDLGRRYAALQPDLPRAARYPARMNAISASLRMPYQTVRRRIVEIAKTGTFVITPKGVLVPEAVTSSAPFCKALDLQYERVRALYDRLRAIGALEAPRGVARGAAAPPLRLMGRLISEYVLRFNEPIAEHFGDPVSGVVLMGLIEANTGYLGDDDDGSEPGGPEDFLADARRRPIAIRALAAMLGLPHETVRRRVGALSARGLCRRVEGGYIVPAEALGREAFLRVMLVSRANLARLYAALDDAGVLAGWEQERRGQAA